jgi:hypothetical protein
VENILSCYRAMSHPCVVWHRTVVLFGTVAVLSHCIVESPGTVAMLYEWSTGWRCAVVAL